MIVSTCERGGRTLFFGTHRAVDSAVRSLRRLRAHPVYGSWGLRLWIVDDGALPQGVPRVVQADHPVGDTLRGATEVPVP